MSGDANSDKISQYRILGAFPPCGHGPPPRASTNGGTTLPMTSPIRRGRRGLGRTLAAPRKGTLSQAPQDL